MSAITDHWQQIDEIFEAALAQPAESRESFLLDRCGNDQDLLAEVRSLIEHAQQVPEGFLKTPDRNFGDGHDESLTKDYAEALIGQRIGQYTLQRKLASGGMGTVYLAEQAHPQRPVAVKVMRQLLASKKIQRRFEFESQILAHLHHPHIAQVYDAGTFHPDGQERSSLPYFVMEYVPDARSITQYARENNLAIRQKLELFGHVCDAVHHGHQKRVIHRDLKPANILVDASGCVKIIDFGVAHGTDSDIALTTIQTDIGQVIGTLQYMSPEQCDGQSHNIDVRSDVYSLGVVLYELLADQLPYRVGGTSIYKATRVIHEEAPKRLGAVNRKLRGDLEAMVSKALEKAPSRRYASAEALGADILRSLNHQPIEARPPTAWTQGVRWIMRHPLWTTASLCTAITVSVSASIFAGVWYYDRQPYKAVLNRDGTEAQLLARTGKLIKSWTSSVENGVSFAELVERPNSMGGGKLLLLGFRRDSKTLHARSLCTFAADGDLEHPLFPPKQITDDDIPPELPGNARHSYRGNEFSFYWAQVMDIFPDEESPGQEIFAGFYHGPYSARVYRIYDLNGNLLYQFWHDGGIDSILWFDKAHLLIASGADAVVYSNKREYQPPIKRIHPLVVFAIRPKLGHIGQRFVNPEYSSDPNMDDPDNPLWYKTVMPPELVDDPSCTIKLDRVDYGKLGPDQSFQIGVHFTRPIDSGVSWLCNLDGQLVDKKSHVISDNAKANLSADQLAHLGRLHLAPLPRIKPEVAVPGVSRNRTPQKESMEH